MSVTPPQFACTGGIFPTPGAAMALSREVVSNYDGKEIVLVAAYANRCQMVQLRLYVGSVCVDQRAVSAFDMNTHTLRGRLKLSPQRVFPVTATLKLEWFKKPTYTVVVGGRVIHEEQGPWHSL